jgi:hypothetical protein
VARVLGEDEVMLSVLAGLPKEYKMAIPVLDSTDEMLNLNKVLPKLMHVEQRTANEEVGERAFIAKNKARQEDGNKIQSYGSKECWDCGKVGQFKAQCKKKAKNEGRTVRNNLLLALSSAVAF